MDMGQPSSGYLNELLITLLSLPHFIKSLNLSACVLRYEADHDA